eukprot:2710531-Amphidinium_carterae.1
MACTRSSYTSGTLVRSRFNNSQITMDKLLKLYDTLELQSATTWSSLTLRGDDAWTISSKPNMLATAVESLMPATEGTLV